MDFLKSRFALVFSISVIVIVAVYSIAIKVKQNDLNGYITQINDRLMELVPESEKNENLRAARQEFEEKVRQREIDPEEIEVYASRILNLSKDGRILSPVEAESLLVMTIKKREQIAKQDSELLFVAEPEKKWELLEQKIGKVIKFQNTVQDSLNNVMHTKNDSLLVHYKIDDDLRIIINEHQEKQLSKVKIKELQKEIEALQKENLIITINIDSVMEINRKKVEAEKKQIKKEENLIEKEIERQQMGMDPEIR